MKIKNLKPASDVATLDLMDEAIRSYMKEIGAKGGKANKGKAADKCRAAARARWAKHREKAEAEGNARPKKGKTRKS